MTELPINPWLRLEPGQCVLEEDRLAVRMFKNSAPDHVRLHDSTCPEPFFGDVDAPIVVLLLNPGVSDGDYDPDLDDVVRGRRTMDGHFYLRKRHRWWERLFGGLMENAQGVDVARKVLSVEFVPYRSVSFGCGHVRFPSQEYAFALVRRAIERGAAIVIVRGSSHWLGAVPELHAYGERTGRLIHVANPRMASLTANNLRLGKELADELERKKNRQHAFAMLRSALA